MLRSISVSESPSRAYKIFAAASGRVYHKQFADADCDWSYSGHKGVIMFGRGRNDADNRLSAASVVQGGAEPNGLWFRLTDGGRTTWRFPVPLTFDYKVDKPFFHIFSGSVSRAHSPVRVSSLLKAPSQSRMFGFRFDDDLDAASFCKEVMDRTRSTFRQLPFPSLAKQPKSDVAPWQPARQKSQRSTSMRPGGKANSVPVPGKPRITTSMISAPQPNSFVHIAHVGISEKGVIEATKDVDPRWTSLLKELSGYGVTRSVCEEHLDFIEGFLAGAKSVGGSPVEKKPKG
jgi:neural Wiskott-Aldrich syndrome protein